MSKKMDLFDNVSMDKNGDCEISYAEIDQEMSDQIREEEIMKDDKESDFEVPDFVARD